HSSYRYFSRYSSLIESPTPRICVRSLHDALPILHGGHVVGHAGDELTAAPAGVKVQGQLEQVVVDPRPEVGNHPLADEVHGVGLDRKSTRLNSSHVKISYAVICLKKIKKTG